MTKAPGTMVSTPAAASTKVPSPAAHPVDAPTAAANATLYAVSAVASLSRLSPPISVITRRGSPSRRPTALADTASGGATMAPSVNAAAMVSSGTTRNATNPTASVVTSGSPTASEPIEPTRLQLQDADTGALILLDTTNFPPDIGWRLAFGIGVEPQYVEKPGRGRYAYDNMLSYLTHVKYADKHQYAPSEVATVRGPDYLGIDAQRRETWLKGRAHVKKKVVAENFEDMRERVLQGEITRDQIMLTDELFDIYSRHQREIDDALSAYGQRRAYRAAAKLRAGAFSTHVVFVHGDAGIGKTRFATDFITEAINAANAHGERWQVYRAATGNPLDDWRGEEVLLLDDLRASAMDANDWLLLLDPYNASPAKARYKNKGEVAPRLIVITATIEPVEFFYYARQKGNVDEALDQFIRRLASVVKVYRADDINRYLVQHIGKIEPYEWHQCSVPAAAHTPGMYGNAYHQNVGSRELTYGPETSAEHDAEGAVAELLGGLAVRSPDVPLALIGGAA